MNKIKDFTIRLQDTGYPYRAEIVLLNGEIFQYVRETFKECLVNFDRLVKLHSLTID